MLSPYLSSPAWLQDHRDPDPTGRHFPREPDEVKGKEFKDTYTEGSSKNDPLDALKSSKLQSPTHPLRASHQFCPSYSYHEHMVKAHQIYGRTFLTWKTETIRICRKKSDLEETYLTQK